MLESSSFAESVWSMGGINITNLLSYQNTYPLHLKLCQAAKHWGRQQHCADSKWRCIAAPLGSESGKSGSCNKHTAKQEQFPSLTVLVHTDLTWCWSLLLCQVLRRDRDFCVLSSQTHHDSVHSITWDRAWERCKCIRSSNIHCTTAIQHPFLASSMTSPSYISNLHARHN